MLVVQFYYHILLQIGQIVFDLLLTQLPESWPRGTFNAFIPKQIIRWAANNT